MPHFAAFVYNTSGGGGGGGGVTSFNGATGAVVVNGITYTASTSAPGSPSVGDRWIDTDTGILYVYFDDGAGSQWVEF